MQLVYTFDKDLPLSALRDLTTNSISQTTNTVKRVITNDGNGVSKDVMRFLRSSDKDNQQQTHVQLEDQKSDNSDKVTSNKSEQSPTECVNDTIELDQDIEDAQQSQTSDDDVIITNHCLSPGIRCISQVELPSVPTCISIDTSIEAPLSDLVMLKRNRLSITPVTTDEWNTIVIAAQLFPSG